MPTGCATWPAWWSFGKEVPGDPRTTWPNLGEIDIIEGVNVNTQNQAALHTNNTCKFDSDAAKRASQPFSGHRLQCVFV